MTRTAARAAVRPRRDAVVVAAVVALLGVLSALVAIVGPVELGPPRVAAVGTVPIERDRAEAPRSAVDAVQPEQADGLPGWVLVVLWTLAAAAVLALAWRSIRSAGSAPPDEDDDATRAAVGADGASYLLGGVRIAAREAADDLRRAGPADVADAVVLAWERLEAAAAAAGAARPAHVTTTEFTSGLLRRLGAEPEAARRLLHLYHRARFSSAPLPQGAGAAAAATYDAVVASLRRAVPGPGQARDGPPAGGVG